MLSNKKFSSAFCREAQREGFATEHLLDKELLVVILQFVCEVVWQ